MVENLRARVAFIVVLLVAAGFVLVRPIWNGESPFNLGLDLSGGVTLRYQLPTEDSDIDADTAQATTRQIFQNRLDSTGMKEFSIREIGTDQVEIAIPGIAADEADAYKKTLESIGRLEFRLEAWDDAQGLNVAEETRRLDEEITRREEAGETITRDSDFSNISRDLSREAQSITFKWVPVGLRFAEDYCRSFGESYVEGKVYWRLLRIEDVEGQHFSGEQIEDVYQSQDSSGFPAAGFEISPGRPASDFARFTETNIGKSMVIVLDDEVQSIANIESRIAGKGVITGGSDGFTQEELARLIAVIRSGSLPVKPILVDEFVSGPSLGEAAINRGLVAGLLALGLVLVFLLIYYRVAGIVACAALSVNVLLLMATLSFLEATLTLPGIAGLVLTIGMAVDANILIFERIREEHEKGKTLAQAIKTGFEKAFLTIIDANVTTFLTAFFLYRFGTGPIRGFAVTLMIGLLSSMFSALFFSKTIFAWFARRKMEQLSMLRLLANPRVPFLAMRRKAFVFSLVAILAGLALFVSLDGSRKYGMDFTGGLEVQLQFRVPMAQADVLQRVQNQFPDAGVQVVTVGSEEAGRADRFQVKIKALEDTAQAAAQDASSPAESFGRELRGLFETLVPDPLTDLEIGEPDAGGSTPLTFAVNFDAPVRKADVAQALSSVVRIESIEGDESAESFPVQAFSARGFAGAEDVKARILPVVRSLPRASGGGVARLTDPMPSRAYIGPRAGTELRDAAVRAILFSLVGIILYIRIRFRQYRYGFAACLALVHDVLFTLGAIALVQWIGIVDVEIDLAIVAAFLTIIGYSLNDTIVIFDRIRENLPRSDKPLPDVLDHSINQTLSRTILTSLTTLISVAILFAFNLGQRNVLEGFGFSLIIGVMVGTYSTIFVASPAVLILSERIQKARAARRG